jgi:hypothetical protein
VLKQDKIKQLYVLRQKGRKLKVNFFWCR